MLQTLEMFSPVAEPPLLESHSFAKFASEITPAGIAVARAAFAMPLP
jgi:hypothetical protein